VGGIIVPVIQVDPINFSNHIKTFTTQSAQPSLRDPSKIVHSNDRYSTLKEHVASVEFLKVQTCEDTHLNSCLRNLPTSLPYY
jgi:hypothetical protein